ncbi:hypothetical protein O1611_g3358 [Lasiodiplodia mahajangana]|uniref:Uncharacterized protein n=1 Tax=Lasiodiplodia mahajangana TaxID=1108764 RepID=A0ACC2JS19_9PEZI|nr:hypothetical protein O1611_g3358 [Lasiodiplodia mahajangana]
MRRRFRGSTDATQLLEKMHAAQESVRRAEARESVARRRRAESESAAQSSGMRLEPRDVFELEFGPSSSNSQP